MALPTLTQSWIISANNRFTFLSTSTVIQVMQAFVWGLKQFLKANGYVVKGSASAGTGAMDGVDRWTASSDVTPRNNGNAGSQAWIVLTDGTGVDTALSFNSASDDIFRIAHSPSGVYVAAGTANQQPTATDECWNATSGTWVNATTSIDRVFHYWCTRDKTMFRAAVVRNATLIACMGVEKTVLGALVSPAQFSANKPVLNFYNTLTTFAATAGNPSAAYSAAVGGALARVHTFVDVNVQLGGIVEAPIGLLSNAGYGVEKPALQSQAGHILIPYVMGSSLTNAQGKLGNRIDWWVSYNNGVIVLRDHYGDLQLLAFGDCIIWPWDSVTDICGI